jgi:hypothetical protein
VRPADEPKPPAPNPPAPKPPAPKGELVQPAGQAIELGVGPLQVFFVLFPEAQKNQAVVVLKPELTKPEVRLDRFDLTTGAKVDGMVVSDYGTSVRDVSPDCRYYVQNHAGTPYSIHAWPDPAAVVNKWLPQPAAPDPQSVGQTVVAAYMLDGGKLLTVNGAGQVVRWAVPAAAGGQPTREAFYLPPPAVANYARGLGYGLTAISPDRKRLAVYNGSDGFFVLDIDTLKLAAQLRSPEDARPTEGANFVVLGVAFSPDGNHLAGLFHQQRLPGMRPPKKNPVPGAAPAGPTLIRWDVQEQRVTARVTDPSRNAGGAGARIGWWGTDYCWVSYPSRGANLFSWEKQNVALRDELRPGSRVFFGSPDGKCWFMVNGPDNKAVLKSVDLPADALKAADQPLALRADGIVRK